MDFFQEETGIKVEIVDVKDEEEDDSVSESEIPELSEKNSEINIEETNNDIEQNIGLYFIVYNL